MADPYCLLFVHYIWSTWQRMPLVTPNIEKRVYESIVVKCRELKSEPIAVGGTMDHVHLLVQIAPVISVARLAQEAKGASSHLVTHQLAPSTFFKWQGGYGALTVDEASLPRLSTYIKNQKTHHEQGRLISQWEAS